MLYQYKALQMSIIDCSSQLLLGTFPVTSNKENTIRGIEGTDNDSDLSNPF